MGENDVKAMGMAEWMESYYLNAVSEQYDDLVSYPGQVVASFVCVEFEEIDEGEGECGHFSIAIPSSTTTSEIRRVLESLTTAADPCGVVIDALGERYEKTREVSCDTEAGVGTQLFHSQGYGAVVLVEGTSWRCTLKMAYSFASAIVSVEFGEDLSISDLLDRLLAGRIMWTSYFEIPLNAFES